MIRRNSMSYCPGCKYEYIDGIEKCPDCDMELVSELPVDDEPNMVAVYKAEDPTEATILYSILEEAGIPVQERTVNDRALDIFAGPIGEEAIVVPTEYADEAKRIIEEALASGALLPESEEDISPEEELFGEK
jgi:hypothetical protein